MSKNFYNSKNRQFNQIQCLNKSIFEYCLLYFWTFTKKNYFTLYWKLTLIWWTLSEPFDLTYEVKQRVLVLQLNNCDWQVHKGKLIFSNYIHFKCSEIFHLCKNCFKLSTEFSNIFFLFVLFEKIREVVNRTKHSRQKKTRKNANNKKKFRFVAQSCRFQCYVYAKSPLAVLSRERVAIFSALCFSSPFFCSHCVYSVYVYESGKYLCIGWLVFILLSHSISDAIQISGRMQFRWWC